MASGLALAGLLALSGSCEEWSDYSKGYSRHVVALLGRLPSTRRHAAFILEERIPLIFTDSPTRVDDHVLGAYDLIERRMYLDEVRLLDGAEDLVDQGVPKAEAAEILAWKTLPTIVHEITHAMAHRDLKRRMGGPMSASVVENEIVAFYDEVLALRDMFRERPKLWERERILKIESSAGSVLLALEDGPDALDRVIRLTYHELPSLADGLPLVILRDTAANIGAIEAALAEFERVGREGRPQEKLEFEQRALRSFGSLTAMIRYATSRLELHRRFRDVLTEPKSRESLKAYYKAELAWRREKLGLPKEKKP